MIGLVRRITRKQRRSKVRVLQWVETFPDHLLRSARTKPLARVELLPASNPTTALYGPCTVAKIIRPGDHGPALSMYHVLVPPDGWLALSYGEIRQIADVMGVETGDLTKAVDQLCGVR